MISEPPSARLDHGDVKHRRVARARLASARGCAAKLRGKVRRGGTHGRFDFAAKRRQDRFDAIIAAGEGAWLPNVQVDELARSRQRAYSFLFPNLLSKRGKQVDYEAKTVRLAGRRYIVCRNHQEAEKDAADRASIVAALARQLKRGDKTLVGNAGYRRYLRTVSEQHFAIDADKVEEEKRFDGIFVLRTNTDLNPLEAMLCYKQLWTVEQSFRTAKHLFSTRPIFHKLDETIRGHVFCSFLALVLKSELEERIAALGRVGSWPEIIADLDSLAETEIDYDGKRFIVRSAPRPTASLALRAAGVALPPTVRDAAAS